MSAESENYVTPIFPADEELEEVEEIEVQEGGAGVAVLPKDFLNKHGATLIQMFQKGYATTFSKVLPPIDSVLKFNDADGKVVQIKTLEEMKTNKIDSAYINFPNLVLYQFIQKIALFQGVGASAAPDYSIDKHIALIEISVRLYVLTYLLASKNDFVAQKGLFTEVSDKYFNTKKPVIPSYHTYLQELKDTLKKFQDGFFNDPAETENKALEIVCNILTHYGIVYFKLGNKYGKIDNQKILETENLYFYNTMSEMLDDLLAKIPEPAAPSAEGDSEAKAKAEAEAKAKANANAASAAEAERVRAEAEAKAKANADAASEAEAERVRAEAEAKAKAEAEGRAEGEVATGGNQSRKNRRSSRRNTSRKNRKD